MVAAILMLVVGGVDVGRAFRRRPAVGAIVAVALLAPLLLLGLSAPPPVVGLAVAVAAAWCVATQLGGVAVQAWAAALLALGILVALLVDPLRLDPGSPAAGVLRAGLAAEELSQDRALALAGAILFLVSTANRIVTTVLDAVRSGHDGRERSATAPTDAAMPVAGSDTRRWTLSIRRRRRRIARIEEERPSTQPHGLLGGRVIGPLERQLLLGLTIVGALPVAAGVIAAKGIVRFPEISKDGDRGAKAETFLVGTLASLLTVALAYVTVSTT